MINLYWYDMYYKGEGFLFSSEKVYDNIWECVTDMRNEERFYNNSDMDAHYCKLRVSCMSQDEYNEFMEFFNLGFTY